MKILITGVAGFIGSFLAKKLLETSKDEIIGIDNLNNYVNKLLSQKTNNEKKDIDKKVKKSNILVNHYWKANQITRKCNLLKNLRNLYFKNICIDK